MMKIIAWIFYLPIVASVLGMFLFLGCVVLAMDFFNWVVNTVEK